MLHLASNVVAYLEERCNRKVANDHRNVQEVACRPEERRVRRHRGGRNCYYRVVVVPAQLLEGKRELVYCHPRYVAIHTKLRPAARHVPAHTTHRCILRRRDDNGLSSPVVVYAAVEHDVGDLDGNAYSFEEAIQIHRDARPGNAEEVQLVVQAGDLGAD